MHTKSNGILMLSLGALYIFDTHPIKKPTLKYHIGLLRCRKIELQKKKKLLLTIPLMHINEKTDPKDYSIAPLPILGLTMSTLEDEDFVDNDNEAKNNKNSKKKEKSKTNKKKDKKSSKKQTKNDNEKNNQDNETKLNEEEDLPQVIIDIPDDNDENEIENDQNSNKNTSESTQFENLFLDDEKLNVGHKDLFQSSEPVRDHEKNKKSETESDGIQSPNSKESKKGKNDKKKKDKNNKRKLTNEEDLEKNLLSEASLKNDDEDYINKENEEEEKNDEDHINKKNEEENDSENEEPFEFQELVEASDQDFDNQNDNSDSSEDYKNNNNNNNKNKQKLSKIKEIVIKVISPSHSNFLFRAIYKIFLSALNNVTNSISPKFIPEIQKVEISKKSLTNRAILISHYSFSRGESLDCADYFDDKWNGQPIFVIGPSFHPGGYGVSFGCSIGLETTIKAVIFKRAHFSYISAFLSSLLITTQSVKTIGFTEYPRDKEIKLKFINVKKTNVKSWVLLNCCSSMIKSFAEATDGLPKPIQSLKIGRYSYNKNDANEVFNIITKKKNMRKMLQLSFVSLNFKEFPRASFTKLCTSLANLEELEISRINIDGSTIFQAVCSDARHVHQLVLNGLRFEKSWSMKEKMNLPEGLIFLDLSESYFTDTTLADLFQNITYKVSKLPFFFILRSIQFTETVFPAFESPEFDLKLCQPNILEFDMSGNSFPSKSFESIFHFIATQKRIRNLIFTDVCVDNQRYFVHMLSSVRGCDVLTGIDFSGNFQPVIVQQFISSVSTNQSLKRLSVKNCGALNKGFELIENLLNMVKGLREIEIDGFHPEEKVDLDKRHPLIICWDKIRKSKSILANDLPIKDLADLGFEIEKVYDDKNDVDVDIDFDDDDDESVTSNPDYVKLKVNQNNNFYYKFDDRLKQDDKRMFSQLVKPYRSSPSTIEERLGYLYLCIKKGDVEEIKRAISPEIFQILHQNLKPIENTEKEVKEKEIKKNKNKTDIEPNTNKVNFDPDLFKNAINQQNDRSELVSTISTLSKTIKIDKKSIENDEDEDEGFEKVDDKNDDSDDLNIDILLSDKIDADFNDINSSSDFSDFLRGNDENKDVVADVDDGDKIQMTKTTSKTVKLPSLTEVTDDDDLSDINLKLSHKNLLEDKTIKNDTADINDDDTDDDFSDFLNQTQNHPQIYKTMNQSKEASDTLLNFLEEESDSNFEVTKKGADALISKTLGKILFVSDDETNNKKAKKNKNKTKTTAKPKNKNSKNTKENPTKDSNKSTKNKTNNKSDDDSSDFDFNQNNNYKNDVDYDEGSKRKNKKKTKNISVVNHSDDDNDIDDDDVEFGYLKNNQNANKNKQSIQLEFDSDDQPPKVINNNSKSNKHKSRKNKASASNENTNQKKKKKSKSNKDSEKRVKFSNHLQQEKTHKNSLLNDDNEEEIESEIQQNKKDKKQMKKSKSTSNKHQKIKNSENDNKESFKHEESDESTLNDSELDDFGFESTLNYSGREFLSNLNKKEKNKKASKKSEVSIVKHDHVGNDGFSDDDDENENTNQNVDKKSNITKNKRSNNDGFSDDDDVENDSGLEKPNNQNDDLIDEDDKEDDKDLNEEAQNVKKHKNNGNDSNEKAKRKRRKESKSKKIVKESNAKKRSKKQH